MQIPMKTRVGPFILAAAFMTPLQIAGAGDGDPLEEGRRLFDEETFGGNGRTCLTCHSVKTGTISPEDVAKTLKKHDGDPLFRHDGLDDGFSGTARIEQHATIRVEISLPPGITLKDDPSATSVVFNRGVPSTLNTPALDPVLMYDGRDPDLQSQAKGAINGHAQPNEHFQPTMAELDLIAEFQQTDKRFFSSGALRNFAAGGPPPVLPDGNTASEIRGRAMFDDVPVDRDTKAGICAICHSGPMLNESNNHSPFAPPGVRIGSVDVSERNKLGNPVYTFLVEEPGNPDSPVEVVSPDPGVLLNPNQGAFFPPFFPRSFGANFFKMPTLWGAKHTAPYFHDNSAKTLADVAEQYTHFFSTLNPVPNSPFPISLSKQDEEDIVAFMKLLDGDDGDSDGDN